jgi:hypothetical protein
MLRVWVPQESQDLKISMMMGAAGGYGHGDLGHTAESPQQGVYLATSRMWVF